MNKSNARKEFGNHRVRGGGGSAGSGHEDLTGKERRLLRKKAVGSEETDS